MRSGQCAQRTRQDVTRDEMEVVSAVRKGLSERIGQERFCLWFSAGVRLACAHQTLAVFAADQFLLDRLRKQFRLDLEAVGRQVLGVPAELRFEIDPTLKRTSSAGGGSPAGLQLSETPGVSKQAHAAGARGTEQPPRVSGLDSFVVGEGNRIAFTAAHSVVQRPGVISPLLIHGPTGCGKTHLLTGIWAEFRRRTRSGRAVLLSAEQFTTLFLEALHGRGLPSFRHKCRDVDLLVVDDLQFFAGKRATVVELLHTIDSLLRQGRQLVLAADRPAASLAGLGPELVARLTGGLVCGIEAADYATRLGICRQLAARLEVSVPPRVLELVAAELSGDARQIAGALHRLQATSLALQQPITVELASAALEDLFRATRRLVHIADVERAVCDVFGLEPKSLRDGGKSKSVTQPRMIAMWLARKYTRAAFSEISRYFGRRSHSTVISAERTVNRWMANGTSILVGQATCRAEEALRRVETQLRMA